MVSSCTWATSVGTVTAFTCSSGDCSDKWNPALPTEFD